MYSVCFELEKPGTGELLHEVRECYPHNIVALLSIFRDRGVIPSVVGMYRVSE